MKNIKHFIKKNIAHHLNPYILISLSIFLLRLFRILLVIVRNNTNGSVSTFVIFINFSDTNTEPQKIFSYTVMSYIKTFVFYLEIKCRSRLYSVGKFGSNLLKISDF